MVPIARPSPTTSVNFLIVFNFSKDVYSGVATTFQPYSYFYHAPTSVAEKVNNICYNFVRSWMNNFYVSFLFLCSSTVDTNCLQSLSTKRIIFINLMVCIVVWKKIGEPCISFCMRPSTLQRMNGMIIWTVVFTNGLMKNDFQHLLKWLDSI